MTRYKLSDGTDISRMTVDEITAAQRKLSPKFPDILTQLERRQRDRENIAARFFLWVLAPAGLITLFWSTFGWAMFGAGVVGFIVVCFVASGRAHKRQGSPTRGQFG